MNKIEAGANIYSIIRSKHKNIVTLLIAGQQVDKRSCRYPWEVRCELYGIVLVVLVFSINHVNTMLCCPF